jgi:hypothetical protein
LLRKIPDIIIVSFEKVSFYVCRRFRGSHEKPRCYLVKNKYPIPEGPALAHPGGVQKAFNSIHKPPAMPVRI